MGSGPSEVQQGVEGYLDEQPHDLGVKRR